jgi:hypothetical protein
MTIKLTSPVVLILLLSLLLGVAMMSVAVVTATPVESVVADLHSLPSSTPTVTPTPGWWEGKDFEATPALKKLPGVPKPAFKGDIGGEEAGKPIKIKTLSCPTAGVTITGVETGGGVWWRVIGVASIPNLWYWKIEASLDGRSWLHLYRQDGPASGVLSRVNLSTLPGRPAFFRLTVVDKTGNYPTPCTIQVLQ